MPLLGRLNELDDDDIAVAKELIHQSQDPFTNPRASLHYQPRLPLLPVHLDLDLSFDILQRTVRGRVTHTAKAQWNGAKTLQLHAEDFVQVSVSSPNDEHLSFSYDGHAIDIIFSYPVDQGQSVIIRVDYIVTDPIDGLVFSAERDGHFVVSDHETERARYWLPLVDHPVVRTTISFTLRTQASDNLTVLANGAFTSEQVDEDNMKITKWQMNQITPSYLLCVAIGKFVVADAGEHKGKKISFFAPAGGRYRYTVADLALTFGRTKEMIEFLEDKLSFDLPWPKYYQWACGEVGGAMENSSLVSYDEWYLLDERSAGERSHRVDSTVVHELAHSWFGNTVVCSDFCHSFLKESFATLISAEWYDYFTGGNDFQYTLTMYADVSFAEAAEYVRPIVTRKYETSWDIFDRHLYTNGAWRLHMLRVKLGNDRFWDAVSTYLHKRSWKTVETDDFRKDLEEHTGEQLCSFFEQWFYGKGHPVLEASFAYDASKGNFATVSAKQVQTDVSKGIGLFDITIEVALETAPGTWQTHTMTMESGACTSQLTVKLPLKPLQVVIDPEKKLLHNLRKFSGVGDDMSIRSLLHAPTFAGRCQGARMLQSSASKRARQALRQALKDEEHWGMRLIVIQSIGKIGHIDSLPALIDALLAERDSRVIPKILTSIGEFKDPSAETVLLKFIKEGHDMRCSYGAIGAAIRALGRTRKLEYLELISGYLEDPKKRGKSFEIPQSAAVALGHLRDWKAVKILMRNAEPPNTNLPARVRSSVIRAIGQAVTWEGTANRMKAFEFIEKVCQGDEVKSVREAAGSVLASLADAGNPSSALEKLDKSVENQSKPIIRGFMERARRMANGREGASRSLASTVEKLQDELAQVKARLEEVHVKLDARAADDKVCDIQSGTGHGGSSS